VSQLPYFMGRPDRGPVATTDAFGRFRMNSVPAGTYRLVVMPAGYRGKYLPMGYGAVRANDAGTPTYHPRRGRRLANADVGLTTGAAIEGRGRRRKRRTSVEDSGVSRRDCRSRASRPSESSDLSVVTDDLGRYRVYGLEPGSYIVGADGHLRNTDGRAVSRAGEPRLARLLHGSRIRS
jgi:hypothetical protein